MCSPAGVCSKGQLSFKTSHPLCDGLHSLHSQSHALYTLSYSCCTYYIVACCTYPMPEVHVLQLVYSAVLPTVDSWFQTLSDDSVPVTPVNDGPQQRTKTPVSSLFTYCDVVCTWVRGVETLEDHTHLASLATLCFGVSNTLYIRRLLGILNDSRKSLRPFC